VLLSLVGALVVQAGEAEFASWRGPHGTGAGTDTGARLVERADQARVVWLSQDEVGTEYTDPKNVFGFPITHYCMPVVSGGLVYYTYGIPSGPIDPVLRWKAENSREWDDPAKREHFERGARAYVDDQVMALDARTGATVWRRSFPGRGVSMIFNSNAYGAPIISNGRIYSLGWGLDVYCLDAKTGATIWQTELGPARAHWRKVLDDFLAGEAVNLAAKLRSGELNSYKEHYLLDKLNITPPLLIDDALFVANDSRGALVALDAATGALRWRTEQVIGNGFPLRWDHQGKSYVIATTTTTVSCLEATTGRVLWQAKATSGGWGTNVIHDDLLVVGSSGKNSMACHRLSLQGLQPHWSLVGERGSANYSAGYSTPAVYRDHVFTYIAEKPNTIHCIRLADGKVVRSVALPEGSRCNSIIVADGHLWHGADTYLPADPDRDDLLRLPEPWPRLPNDLRRTANTTHAVAGGRVYYRTGTRIAAADYRVATEPPTNGGQK
jgi:outer membrane protein assembly factor BamB